MADKAKQNLPSGTLAPNLYSALGFSCLVVASFNSPLSSQES